MSKSADTEGMRAKITSKLAEALAGDASSGIDPKVAEELAAEVETEMRKAYGNVTKEYTAKARSLVFNLNKNSELRKRVLGRQITPAKLVSASAKELAPEQIKMQRAQSIDRSVRRSDVAGAAPRLPHARPASHSL